MYRTVLNRELVLQAPHTTLCTAIESIRVYVKWSRSRKTHEVKPQFSVIKLEPLTQEIVEWET